MAAATARATVAQRCLGRGDVNGGISGGEAGGCCSCGKKQSGAKVRHDAPSQPKSRKAAKPQSRKAAKAPAALAALAALAACELMASVLTTGL